VSADSTEAQRRWLLFGVGGIVLLVVLLALAVLPKLSATAARSAADRWRPSAGFRPLTDAQAANRVKRRVENRPDNRAANGYVPSPDELERFHRARDEHGAREKSRNPYLAAVTGHFAGTTDEIIQWAAQKWGIPANWLRAQYVIESHWRQSGVGDLETVTPSQRSQYPDFSCPSETQCYESLGISQVKWRPDGSVHPGTEPLRWKSTAFNADFQAATVRYFFDNPHGRRSAWGDSSYRRRQKWLSVAGWYEPYPWGNSSQREYAQRVQRVLTTRPWKRHGF
jgi:hypothetical protein